MVKGKKKVKPDPVPADKARGYVRGLGAIIALPKNKRGKMTVEDTVTKSSSGQIGEASALKSFSQKTDHVPPPPPPPLPPLSTTRCPLSLRSCSHYQRGHTVEKVQEGFEVSVRNRSSMSGQCEAAGLYASARTCSHVHACQAAVQL